MKTHAGQLAEERLRRLAVLERDFVIPRMIVEVQPDPLAPVVSVARVSADNILGAGRVDVPFESFVRDRGFLGRQRTACDFADSLKVFDLFLGAVGTIGITSGEEPPP